MSLSTNQQVRLLHQHESLFDLINPVSNTRLRMAPEAGKWSVFENMVHLETYQHTFLKRINEILSNDNPSFDRYMAEMDPLFHDHLTKNIDDLIDELQIVRKQLANKLLNLDDEKLKRRGRHPVYGDLTITDWVEFFLLHEAHHLFTIFKIINRK